MINPDPTRTASEGSDLSKISPTGIAPIITPTVDIYRLELCEYFTASRVPSSIPAVMSIEERVQYKSALLGELAFLKNIGKSVPEVSNDITLEALHDLFVRHGIGKLQLTGLTPDGVGVQAQFSVSPFPAYKQFHSLKNDSDLRVFGANVGACTWLLTTEEDGSSKIVFQDRSTKNELFSEVPGASIAGLMDAAPFNSEDQIDVRAAIENHLKKEAKEEIGGSLSQVTIVGLAVGKVAAQAEVLTTVQSSNSSEQIKEIALKNKNPDNAVSFRENIVFLPATSETVFTLLADSGCPFPPTHAAGLLLLGATLAEKEGKCTAAEFIQTTSLAIADNHERQGFKSYEPSKSPADQRFPTFQETLEKHFAGRYEYVECRR